MQFGTTTKIKSLALTPDLPEMLYPSPEGADMGIETHKITLQAVVDLLMPVIGTFPKGYTLIVLQEVMNAFNAFADEIYSKSHKEATGLFAGYYLHNPDDPEVKVAVATTFLEARGDATTVTCEISHEDGCIATHYCDRHGLIIIVWSHSHPGFGVFYSDTDSSTLATQFNAEQHAGIVVDNLQGRYLAYKIINGLQEKIPIWGFSLEDCQKTGKLDLFQYLDVPARPSFSMQGSARKPQQDEPARKNELVPKTIEGTVRGEAADLAAIRANLESMNKSMEEIKLAMWKSADKKRDNPLAVAYRCKTT